MVGVIILIEYLLFQGEVIGSDVLDLIHADDYETLLKQLIPKEKAQPIVENEVPLFPIDGKLDYKKIYNYVICT